MKHSVVGFHTLALTLMTILSGCQQENHRWQTVVHPDGSVTRSISQPAENLPAEAVDDEHWSRRHAHEQIDRNIWPERITAERFQSTKPITDDSELPYLLMEGKFESLQEVPQHYRYQLEGTKLASELKHGLTINDYGLVKEYLWFEGITDVVKLEEIPQARRETIELITKILNTGLQEGLGDEYDFSKLISWVENEGEQMLEELTLLMLSPEIRSLDDDARKKRFEKVVASYGMPEMSEDGLKTFLLHQLQTGIERKDGKPVAKEVFESFLKETDSETRTPVQSALQKAAVQHLGEGEEANAKLAALAARQIGIHGVPMVGSPQKFDVWLKMPGEVVETNGTIDEDGFLNWSFQDNDIWPFGYEMTARSILPVRVRDSNVLRKEKLSDRNEMLKFLHLVQSDEELQTVITSCLKENSLAPLKGVEKARREAAGSPEIGKVITTEEEANWRKARQLLDLLNQDAAAQ